MSLHINNKLYLDCRKVEHARNRTRESYRNPVSRLIFNGLLIIVFICTLILPSEVKAIYATKASMKFVWNEASGNPEFYNVYVSVDGGGYILMGTTPSPSYTIEGEDGHNYKMKVQAADSDGNVGPMSDESEVVICDFTPPELVSDLSIILSSVILSWTPVEDAASYSVYRDTTLTFTPDKENGTNRVATHVTDGDSDVEGVQWEDTVDETDKYYFYVVTAVDGAGNESEESLKACYVGFKLHATPDTNYTWIALPFLSDITTAEELGEKIGGECISIGRFDSETQSYITHVLGTPLFNFPVVAGHPYRIEVSKETELRIEGKAVDITQLQFSQYPRD